MHTQARRTKHGSRGRFAGFSAPNLENADEREELYVLGTAASLFHDPASAAAIHEENHLQPWGVDPSVTVDRYDARLLLDQLPSWDRELSLAGETMDESEQELDDERYHDLDESLDPELQPVLNFRQHDNAVYQPGPVADRQTLASQATAAGAATTYLKQLPPVVLPQSGPGLAGGGSSYSAVAFSYASSDQQQAQTEVVDVGPQYSAGRRYEGPALGLPATSAHPSTQVAGLQASDPFVPCFPVPERLQPHLPPTERLHKIILETSRFVRLNGGQVEVLLKVRQASNPNFGFLMPNHPIHPYYRYLVDVNPQQCTGPSATAEAGSCSTTLQVTPPGRPSTSSNGMGQSVINTTPAHGLSALLQAYDHDEDEEEEGGCEEAEISGPSLPSPSDPAAAAAALAAATTAAATAGATGVVSAGFSPDVTLMDSTLVARTAVIPHSSITSGLPGDGLIGGSVQPASDDVSAIIDKLVAFVKKNGAKFEAVVRAKETSNPRFAFLHPWNASHTMYQERLVAALGLAAVTEMRLPPPLQLSFALTASDGRGPAASSSLFTAAAATATPAALTATVGGAAVAAAVGAAIATVEVPGGACEAFVSAAAKATSQEIDTPDKEAAASGVELLVSGDSSAEDASAHLAIPTLSTVPEHESQQPTSDSTAVPSCANKPVTLRANPRFLPLVVKKEKKEKLNRKGTAELADDSVSAPELHLPTVTSSSDVYDVWGDNAEGLSTNVDALQPAATLGGGLDRRASSGSEGFAGAGDEHGDSTDSAGMVIVQTASSCEQPGQSIVANTDLATVPTEPEVLDSVLNAADVSQVAEQIDEIKIKKDRAGSDEGISRNGGSSSDSGSSSGEEDPEDGAMIGPRRIPYSIAMRSTASILQMLQSQQQPHDNETWQAPQLSAQQLSSQQEQNTREALTSITIVPNHSHHHHHHHSSRHHNHAPSDHAAGIQTVGEGLRGPEGEQDGLQQQLPLNAEHLLQRRLRARLLLAKRNASAAADAAASEAQARARSILHHRHFFLRAEEEEAAQLRSAGSGAGSAWNSAGAGSATAGSKGAAAGGSSWADGMRSSAAAAAAAVEQQRAEAEPEEGEVIEEAVAPSEVEASLRDLSAEPGLLVGIASNGLTGNGSAGVQQQQQRPGSVFGVDVGGMAGRRGNLGSDDDEEELLRRLQPIQLPGLRELAAQAAEAAALQRMQFEALQADPHSMLLGDSQRAALHSHNKAQQQQQQQQLAQQGPPPELAAAAAARQAATEQQERLRARLRQVVHHGLGTAPSLPQPTIANTNGTTTGDTSGLLRVPSRPPPNTSFPEATGGVSGSSSSSGTSGSESESSSDEAENGSSSGSSSSGDSPRRGLGSSRRHAKHVEHRSSTSSKDRRRDREIQDGDGKRSVAPRSHRDREGEAGKERHHHHHYHHHHCSRDGDTGGGPEGRLPLDVENDGRSSHHRHKRSSHGSSEHEHEAGKRTHKDRGSNRRHGEVGERCRTLDKKQQTKHSSGNKPGESDHEDRHHRTRHHKGSRSKRKVGGEGDDGREESRHKHSSSSRHRQDPNHQNHKDPTSSRGERNGDGGRKHKDGSSSKRLRDEEETHHHKHSRRAKGEGREGLGSEDRERRRSHKRSRCSSGSSSDGSGDSQGEKRHHRRRERREESRLSRKHGSHRDKERDS